MTSDKRMSDERLDAIKHAYSVDVDTPMARQVIELLAEVEALRSALAHEISERDRLSLENSELRTAIEAAKRVEDGKVAFAITWLRERARKMGGDTIASCNMMAAADLLTRLSAAKEEAERERDAFKQQRDTAAKQTVEAAEDTLRCCEECQRLEAALAQAEQPAHRSSYDCRIRKDHPRPQDHPHPGEQNTMTIAERMARANFAGLVDIEDNDSITLSDDALRGMRAALRAVRPEDVTDGMVLAAGKEYWGALWDTDEGSDKEWLLSDPGLALRRAIAAAISKGSE